MQNPARHVPRNGSLKLIKRGASMDVTAAAFTLFAVLLPEMQSGWTLLVLVAMAVVCVCAWVLVAAEIRRTRNSASPATDRLAGLRPLP